MDFFIDRTTNIDQAIQDSFYPGLVSEADGIDLRIELNRLLYGTLFKKPKGHWVIVRVFDRNSTSKFWNPYTKEGVMGPAHNYEDILVRTRSVPLRIARNAIDDSKAAEIAQHGYEYYFEYTVPIKDGDQIFELDVKDHTNKPTSYNLVKKFDVSRAHEYRLENGNVQYIKAVATYNGITY